MNKFLIGAVGTAAIVAIGPAFAQQPPAPAPQVVTQVQPKPMRVHTRDEVVRHVRELFARLDTNRDGFLTKAEADAARQTMRSERREKFAKRLAGRGRVGTPPNHIANRGAAFDRLDANKDGMISRQEFEAARTIREQRRIVMHEGGVPGAPGAPRELRIHRMGGMAGLHGRMFETADANRDGRVSLQEATAAAVSRFDTADTNRDGRLTPDERMQMRKIRIQRQPA